MFFLSLILACSSSTLGSFCFLGDPIKDKSTVRLGGPRKVSVDIVKTDSTYLLTATFIPVRSFDNGLNTALSRDKGDAYIREALFKHLDAKNGQSIEINQVKKLKTNYSKDLFTYVVEIPIDSIKLQLIKQEKSKDKPQTIIAPPKSILNAKADQLATLGFILKTNEADYPSFKNDLDDFYKKVAESENTIIERLEAFVKGLKNDKFLLSIERDDLIQKTNHEISNAIYRLQTLVESAEIEAVKEPD